MIVNQYPKPLHNTIVEPFAGGAAYSLRWYQHKIILYELNQKTYDMWKFILSADAPYYIKQIPILKKGDLISENIIINDMPQGLINILKATCNLGTAGISKNYNTVTKLSAENWVHNTTKKLMFWWPKIRHWKIINKSYTYIPNVKATFFIDPPYDNKAGQLYSCSDINYNKLAKWCLNQRGQIIVCENYGAKWLPFIKMRKTISINSKYKKIKSVEAIYTKIL